MKIFCVGVNYRKHVTEFDRIAPVKDKEQIEDPVIFLKPESAIWDIEADYQLPDFSNEIHYETELVFRMSKAGRNISKEHAIEHIDAVTVGLDLTARDLQRVLRAKGMPWDISKGFDGSAILGRWFPLPSDIHSIDFSLEINNIECQHGNAKDMIHSIEKVMAYVSRFYAIEPGDVIFTGTPEGVGPIHSKDILMGKIGTETVFELRVR